MSATGQNDNNDTQRIDNDTGTVRLNDNQDTQRIDNDTVRIGASVGTVNLPGMGNAVGNMSQQNVQINADASNNTGELFSPGQVIEVNNKRCVIESVISMSSGEAVVYKVNIDGWPFVLKYYKINTPLSNNAKDVLRKIKDSPKEKIVKLSDFGRRYDQDYEIMEFAEGGTLDQYLKVNGPIKDITKLKNIVGQITEGLEQLHNELRIIYQDLKPENIYFRDAQKTTLIMGDFGISSLMEPGKDTAMVTANATTVYAAPDLARIGNEVNAHVGPPVDYFALGITMLHLWIGAKPFQNIPESERLRQIREKDVEFPQDMPAECKTLIQGLIDPLSKSRWGNQHVKRWLAGESLDIEYRKTSITYEPRMFNETENYTNLKELAALMDKYPDRGKQCLYSDILTSWLQKAGDHFMLDTIKNIISTYAADKEAGLYLAIYTLDPTRKFISHGGRSCSIEEIADAIMAESAYYMEELKKASARPYLYFEAVEGSQGKEATEKFRKHFEEYSPKRALALMYLNLQEDGGESITIGSKTYQNPEEAAAETDNRQIALIKEAVQEEDSLFLVWLSNYFGEFFTTTGGFGKLNTSDKFYLLGKFPFLSYKELVRNWEQAAIADLVLLIFTSPGRLDLFEAYAAQNLPFNGQATVADWRPTAMSYLAMIFKDITSDERTGLELVRLLHKKGADINESSGNGSLPLSIAVWRRNIPLVKLLLELGADPNKSDGQSTPLLYAIGKNDDTDEEADRIAIAYLLLDSKANASITDTYHRCALPMAISLESHEKVELISRLLKAGADINSKDNDGDTPLLFAVSAANNLNDKQSALAVIELLLKKGAKTEVLLNDGSYSPLMLAASQNDIEAAQLLLKYGAKKDFTDAGGGAAYVYAAQKNYPQMMDLVDPGADFTSKNRLFLFLKAVCSVLAIGSVFLTMDVVARIILMLHLNYPILLGVSIVLSHLLAAYILIVLFGPNEYLIKLRGTFNFIGRSLQYLIGIPIVFPLAVLLLQFLTRFLPPNIAAALSFPANFFIRPSTGFAMLAGYIALLATIMTGTVYVNRANDKFVKKWQIYRHYSGSMKVSSGNNKHIKKYVLLAAIIGLIVFLFLTFKNSPKKEETSNVILPIVQASVESGQKYFENGDYDNAIKQFDEVIRNNPESAPGYAWRGNTYRRKSQFDTAIKDLSEAIRLDPKYSFAYGRRGEAYRGKGEYNTAIKDFNEAITLNPNDSWAYGSRGQAYKQLGQTEQAIQDFQKAVSLDPSIEWVKKELQAMEAP